MALARAAGCGRGTVQRIEREAVKPTNAVLGNIAVALEVDPGDLFLERR